MNVVMVLLMLSLTSNMLFCGSALDTFKNLQQSAKTKPSSTTSESPAIEPSDAHDATTTPEPANPGTTEPSPDASAAGQPKVPQFRQRGESKAVTLKQVDGSNNGGAASTPSKNLAAWFSEDLYDTPTKASWLQDENYDPNAIADGFSALKKPSDSAEQKPTPKSAESSKGKVLTPVGSGGAGAMMGGGGGGGAASASAVHADDNYRQAVMQQGRAQRTAADASESEEHRRRQQESEASFARRARRAATETTRMRREMRDIRAAQFRARLATHHHEG